MRTSWKPPFLSGPHPRSHQNHDIRPLWGMIKWSLQEGTTSGQVENCRWMQIPPPQEWKLRLSASCATFDTFRGGGNCFWPPLASDVTVVGYVRCSAPLPPPLGHSESASRMCSREQAVKPTSLDSRTGKCPNIKRQQLQLYNHTHSLDLCLFFFSQPLLICNSICSCWPLFLKESKIALI